jgi:signal transduction histidine kinase
LRNLAGRARDLGGQFEAETGDTGGTVVTWRVPLPA